MGETWWQPSHRFDPRGVRIADRHYNRQKPGTNQFVPPGRCLVFRISGIRGAMNDACEAAGHEFLHPEDVPPFCRWCGAALASPATEEVER